MNTFRRAAALMTALLLAVPLGAQAQTELPPGDDARVT